MDTVKIDGVEYCKQTSGGCDACVGSTNHEICEALPGDCLTDNSVFWLRKPVDTKQAELNQFFGQKPITTQILESTPEEEEAWQTQQKSVARGVTDGTAGRDDRLDAAAYIKAIGTDPLNIQVGGGHYKSMAIQPVEYITKNNLPYCEANVIKYISRWREKGGKKDLEKAKHYIDLLIQLENL